jgi:hypothetical protein
MAEIILSTERDDTEDDDRLLSLREAVARANGRDDIDTIVFAKGVGLTRLTQGTEIEITRTLTIEGDADVTITGDATDDDSPQPGSDITDLERTLDPRLDDDTRLFLVGGVASPSGTSF